MEKMKELKCDGFKEELGLLWLNKLLNVVDYVLERFLEYQFSLEKKDEACCLFEALCIAILLCGGVGFGWLSPV